LSAFRSDQRAATGFLEVVGTDQKNKNWIFLERNKGTTPAPQNMPQPTKTVTVRVTKSVVLTAGRQTILDGSVAAVSV
jgi:hypothetical protein